MILAYWYVTYKFLVWYSYSDCPFGSTLNANEQTHNALILAAILFVLPYFTFLFLSFVKVFNTVQPYWGKIQKNYFTNDIFWVHDINTKREKGGLDEMKQQFESIKAESLINDMLYEQAKVADIAVKKMGSVEGSIMYTRCSFFFWFLTFILGLVLTGSFVKLIYNNLLEEINC